MKNRRQYIPLLVLVTLVGVLTQRGIADFDLSDDSNNPNNSFQNNDSNYMRAPSRKTVNEQAHITAGVNDDPLNQLPPVALDQSWESLGATANDTNPQFWGRDIFNEARMALHMRYLVNGQAGVLPDLFTALVSALTSNGFRVQSRDTYQDVDGLNPPAKISGADYFLQVEVHVNTLKNRRQDFTRAVATTDYYLYELKRNKPAYHSQGPTAKAQGISDVVATAEVMRTLKLRIVQDLKGKMVLNNNERR